MIITFKNINFSRIQNLILTFVVQIVGIYEEGYPNCWNNLIKRSRNLPVFSCLKQKYHTILRQDLACVDYVHEEFLQFVEFVAEMPPAVSLLKREKNHQHVLQIIGCLLKKHKHAQTLQCFIFGEGGGIYVTDFCEIVFT